MRLSEWSKIVRRTSLRAASVGIALALIGVLAAFGIGQVLGLDPLSPSPDQQAFSTDGNGGLGAQLSPLCDKLPPGRIALLGRLAPGYTVADLPAEGFRGVQAIDGAEGDLVVITLVPNPYTVRDLLNGRDIPGDIKTAPALQSLGFLLHRSTEQSLLSCNQRLSDKPAASEIANRAIASLIQQGLLTQERIDAGGTTFQLAEDPTNNGHLFFTVLLANPVGGSIPNSSQSLVPYVATIEKATGDILSAGRAHWYDPP